MSTSSHRETAPSADPTLGALPVPTAPAEDRALIGIAYFKLAKGVLFFLLAIAALRLINHDATETAHYWLRHLGIKRESIWLNQQLEHFDPMIHSWRRLISPLLFFYTAVFFVEGIGLLLRKTWAEWMTIIVTASLIPLEVYELVYHPNFLKVAALLTNVAIVGFLVIHRRHVRQRHAAAVVAIPVDGNPGGVR